MDITEIYNSIIDDLNKLGHFDKVKDLEALLACAVTGTEALGLIGKYLFDIKHKEPSIYISIKTLVNKYLIYCKENEIIIK